MRVVFVGTGNAFASGGRNAMAIFLRSRELGVLLDCGPTTLAALEKLGIAPAEVDVILISHHHGDHFGGIPFLVLHECYEGPRDKPLYVAGPAATQSKVEQAIRLFYPGLEPFPFPIEYRDLDPDESFVRGEWTVVPFEVDHFSRGTALGYRVTADGKTVVFSGDTAWTDELVRQSADADLFICECSSFDEPLDRHVSHRDLTENRSRLTAKRTWLVHGGDDVLARERELVFPLAHDGMEVHL